MKKNIILLFGFLCIAQTSFSQVYCAPTYNNPCFNPWSTNDMIDNFWTTGGLTDITNLNTGCATGANNNYSSFLTQYLITSPGTTIGLNIQGAVSGSNGTCLGGSNGCFAQGFAVWIDWNQDGDFIDPGETIYESPSSGHQVFSSSFTIPLSATCGEYRMRARAVFATPGANIDPCNNHSYGETEDYMVQVTNCTNQERTICLGEQATIDYTGIVPINTNSLVVSPNTNVSITIPFVSFSPTDSTSYQLTWTSPDSTWVDSAHIYVNTPLLPTFAGIDDTTCNGDPLTINGILANTTTNFYWNIIYPVGVTTGLVFTPNNVSLTPSITTISAGTYGLIFTEIDTNNVCPDVTDTTNIIFSEEFHTVQFQNPSCFGYSNGIITINTFGTIGAIEYSIDNGVNWVSGNIFTGLASGVYDVVSRDVAGCSYASQITLTDPGEILITRPSDTTVCENGTANLIATSPNGPLFNWNFTANQGPNQFVSPVSDSTITVHATNFSGCSSDTLSILISMYDPINISITEDRTICPEDHFSATVTSTGGYQNYDYSWQANGASKSWGTPVINLNPNLETEYCVTVTDQCESTQKSVCVKVFMFMVPTLEFDSEIIENCEPNAKIAFTLNTTDSLFHIATLKLAGETILLKNKLDGNSRTDTLNVRHADTYDFYIEVQSIFGCKNSKTEPHYITVDPIPNSKFFITPEKATIFQPVFGMVNQSKGSNITYNWTMKGGTPLTSTDKSPEISYPYGVSGEYPINLTTTSDHGCIHSVSGTAIVENEVVLYAPNSFTPDGDNNNDSWRVYIDGIDIYNYHLQVFDRWGALVFESFDTESIWNGTLADGTTVVNGTYVWFIEAANTTTSEVFDYRGTVNIFH